MFKKYKINIPNCPGDFEENIDWDLYKSLEFDTNKHTIFVQADYKLDIPTIAPSTTNHRFIVVKF